MLNKEICKKCINNKGRIYCWDSSDDAQWDLGFIYCINHGNYCVIDDPHKECKYALEHMVMEQNVE